MHLMRNVKINLTFALLGLLALVGCAQPTPIVIFVSPTPGGTDAAVVLPTDMIALETQPPTEPPATPGPTVTFMGPIVGEGYAPPATNTLPPTVTPVAPPTDAAPIVEPTEPPPPDEPTEAPARAGTPLPALDTSDVGIQAFERLDLDDWDEVLRQVDNDLQMGWLKVQIAWDFFQPNGPDDITEDLRRIEIKLEQIRQVRDVKVLISVAKAPDWARSTTDEDGPPNDPQQLANFISLLLREMGNGVDAVEVWNEPNLIREWNGQSLDGATYMRYFDAGYRAVRAYSPNVVVVSAGLAPTGDIPGQTRNDRDYLREMYAAGLASPNYTNIAVGAHPYGWWNPPDSRCCSPGDRGWDDQPQFFMLNTLEDYRSIMVNAGHSDVQLWVTEFGWASWEGLPGQPPQEWMNYVSKWQQADYTLRAIQLMQGLDYVGPMFLWNLNFAQPILIDQRDERVAYSIVLPEGAPRERPLYWMLYDASRPDEELPRYD